MRPRRRFSEVKKEFNGKREGNYYATYNVVNNSVNKNRREVKASDMGPIQKSYFFQRIGFIFLLVTLVISTGYILRLGDTPIIKFVGSKNNQRLTDQTQQDLYNKTKKILDSSFFNKNKATLNMSYLQNQLNSSFPQFSSINITLPLIDNRPVITLTGSEPLFILINTTGQYLINAKGAAFSRSENNINLGYLGLNNIYDQSGYDIQLGKLALSSSDVSFLQEISYQLTYKGYHIDKIVLPVSSREADVYIKNTNYYIKFNLNSNTPKEQIGTFLATISYVKQKNLVINQYYDVRVDGRVYYK
ncbi:MAG: hypothetical protein WCP00_02210 [bacterium]|nr:hypothetical protein [bacterium]